MIYTKIEVITTLRPVALMTTLPSLVQQHRLRPLRIQDLGGRLSIECDFVVRIGCLLENRIGCTSESCDLHLLAK
jgi:hypothetical protein